MLRAELSALNDENYDLDLLGFAEDELGRLLDAIDADPAAADGEEQPANEAEKPSRAGALSERFGIPPFSVFDARKGWWQDRKRAWIDLGIRSELGRGAAPGGSPQPLDRAKNAAPGGAPMPAMNWSKNKARGDGRGRPI